jgi:uncharacterized protein YggE
MEKSKVWFWILFDVFVGVGAITLLFGVLPYLSKLGSSYQPSRVINISAQGLTTATPDLAELTFSVVTQGKNPTDLSNNNNDKMAKVVEFVKSQGVADQDVKTTSYDLQPNYESIIYPTQTNGPTSLIYPPNVIRTAPTITSYTLTQTVEVKIHDLTKVADIMAGLAPLGVNQIGGVNFTFNDPDSVVAIARADALKKARTKAAEMAVESGASLGQVINVNESYYLPMMQKAAFSTGADSFAAPSAPPISAGTQDITDNVNVTFELR